MTSHRIERVQSLFRQEVAKILESEIKDPRMGMVTITRVKAATDLEIVTIYYTVLGDEEDCRETAKTLDRASGFVRGLLGDRIRMRRVPEIRVAFDSTVGELEKLGTLFGQIERERQDQIQPTEESPDENTDG